MVNQERLSIKQLSSLAGVSVCTLHFYDQIGLLIPQRIRENNYRFLYSRIAVEIAADPFLPRNGVQPGSNCRHTQPAEI
ncbi:MAG: hypothetical protein CVU45_06040 [Chloroflexi bacterium HGW-Chloroflexi-7]|nr:MAG: hypothetical protein CVU45_06040 [Chloroflexi bacterium HGW-Chloroflexi-7]